MKSKWFKVRNSWRLIQLPEEPKAKAPEKELEKPRKKQPKEAAN